MVGAVVPWNYPMIITGWKLAPALATGNSVVLKPAEQSPLSALAAGRLASEAGLPDGVLNVVPGLGPEAGEALGRHPDVDKIAFTGSVEVARRFQRYAGESNGKQVLARGSAARAPQVVLADAADLAAAAQAIAWGIFYNAGQTCNAGSRLVVERVRPATSCVERGRRGRRATLAPATRSTRPRRSGLIGDEARSSGCSAHRPRAAPTAPTVTCGGERAQPVPGRHLRASRPCSTASAATAGAGARGGLRPGARGAGGRRRRRRAYAWPTPPTYGLAASVWTRDVAHRPPGRPALRAGTVWVNTYDAGDVFDAVRRA